MEGPKAPWLPWLLWLLMEGGGGSKMKRGTKKGKR
jgi:hypothetical protein